MEFSSRQFADVVVATPVGRIDHSSAGQLELALAPLWEESVVGTRSLVLDFARVEHITSVGLRVLMIAAKQLHGNGARVAVAALRPVVAEIFAISRFDRVLDVFPSVRGALGRFSAEALEAFDKA